MEMDLSSAVYFMEKVKRTGSGDLESSDDAHVGIRRLPCGSDAADSSAFHGADVRAP